MRGLAAATVIDADAAFVRYRAPSCGPSFCLFGFCMLRMLENGEAIQLCFGVVAYRCFSAAAVAVPRSVCACVYAVIHQREAV